MKKSDPAETHAEMFIALQHAVLEGLFEHSVNDRRQFIQLASDILIRMNDAYNRVTTGR